MKRIIIFLLAFLVALAVGAQTQGVSMRATNGHGYGTTIIDTAVSTNFIGDGSGLTNLLGTSGPWLTNNETRNLTNHGSLLVSNATGIQLLRGNMELGTNTIQNDLSGVPDLWVQGYITALHTITADAPNYNNPAMRAFDFYSANAGFYRVDTNPVYANAIGVAIQNSSHSIFGANGLTLNQGEFIGNGGGLTNLPSSSVTGSTELTNFVVLRSGGNDSTAALNDASKPSATITNALALLASTPQTLTNGLIYIPPGERIVHPDGAIGSLITNQSVTVLAWGAKLTNGTHAFFQITNENETLHIIGGQWDSGSGSSGAGAFNIGKNATNSLLLIEHVSPSIAGHDWIIRNPAGSLTAPATVILNDVDVTIMPASDIIYVPVAGHTNSLFVIRNSRITTYEPGTLPIIKVAGNAQWRIANTAFIVKTNSAIVVGAAGACDVKLANCRLDYDPILTNILAIKATSGATVTMQTPFALDAQISNDGTCIVTNTWNFMAQDTVIGNGGSITGLNASALSTGTVPEPRSQHTLTNFNVVGTFTLRNASGEDMLFIQQGDPNSTLTINGSSSPWSVPVTLNNTGVVATAFYGSHTGNGNNLTNLNASSLASGTVTTAINSSNTTLTGLVTIYGSAARTNAIVITAAGEIASNGFGGVTIAGGNIYGNHAVGTPSFIITNRAGVGGTNTSIALYNTNASTPGFYADSAGVVSNTTTYISGTATVGNFNLGQNGQIAWANRSYITSPAYGVLGLTDTAQSLNSLLLGGSSSASALYWSTNWIGLAVSGTNGSPAGNPLLRIQGGTNNQKAVDVVITGALTTTNGVTSVSGGITNLSAAPFAGNGAALTNLPMAAVANLYVHDATNVYTLTTSYQTQTNYGLGFNTASNVFVLDGAAGVITNLVAGTYEVEFSRSVRFATANKEGVYAVLTNGVDTGIESIWGSSGTGVATVGTMEGTVYLPANTQISIGGRCFTTTLNTTNIAGNLRVGKL